MAHNPLCNFPYCLQSRQRALPYAGVWRRAAIMGVGGWKSRTTVEDMDLSLRTFLAGWKAVFLANTTCVNEARPQRLPGLGCTVQG